ncbi:MAG: hypothetical protein GF364_14540 [Candidatus Lokiarchaeota archaeon]|nr:hypothetical protein [Candidatus Lokiarchaeota archaeon]
MNGRVVIMKKVVIIGDLFLDILPSPLPIKKDLVLHEGETFVKSVTFQRGGCAGNFAAVMANLMPSDEILFVSKVGNDQNGDFLINQMQSFGITTKIGKSEMGTAITIAVAYKGGERHFITYNGAMDDFTLEDVNLDLFQDADHLVWRGIWFTPHLLHNAATFLSAAKKHNVSISMDLGFDPFWSNPSLGDVEKRKKSALKSLKYVDYLFGNAMEIAKLTDEDELEKSVHGLFQNQVKNVVIHKGSDGSLIYNQNMQKVMTPAFPEKSKMNPVGTGDTHDAAFLFRLMRGDNIKSAAKYASKAAAYSLSHPAGTKITEKKIEKFDNTM